MIRLFRDRLFYASLPTDDVGKLYRIRVDGVPFYVFDVIDKWIMNDRLTTPSIGRWSWAYADDMLPGN